MVSVRMATDSSASSVMFPLPSKNLMLSYPLLSVYIFSHRLVRFFNTGVIILIKPTAIAKE